LLLKNFSKYIRDDNEEDPTNFVVRGKIREGYDYKLLPKESWNILMKKYGGLEIKRFKDNDYFSRKYIIKFPAVILSLL
jgi:hypothetical protein